MIDRPRLHSRVRTVCTTYGGLHKNQRMHLVKVPTGSTGVVKLVDRSSMGITRVLVNIVREDNVSLWIKVGLAVIEHDVVSPT
jgi:hypothetical protein